MLRRILTKSVVLQGVVVSGVFLGACNADHVMSTEVANASFNSVSASGASGIVYTENNSPAGNSVMVYSRAADGSLSYTGQYPTGGTGTGAGLGSQGAVTLTKDGHWLFAVSAGSNQLSLFQVLNTQLKLVSTVSSNGATPISVTELNGVVYVLNAGGTGNITGFKWNAQTGLTPLANSTRPLSSTTSDPAQIGFSPDGRALVVSEKGTNRLLAYYVNLLGQVGQPSVLASSGQTPFGFAFAHNNHVIVSEAFGGGVDASAASSYQVGRTGDQSSALSLISGSIHTTETAACWVAVTPDNRFSYVANTGSGTVSGYSVAAGGQLSLLDADGRTGITGGAPADESISQDGQFLYVRVGATNNIVGFRINANGSLSALSAPTSLPPGTAGLASR